jgi:Transposase zinc-ribbon domain
VVSFKSDSCRAEPHRPDWQSEGPRALGYRGSTKCRLRRGARHISVTGIGHAPRRKTQETFQFHLLNPTPYRAPLLSVGSPLLLIRLTQQAAIRSVEGCPNRRFPKRCGSFKASSPPRKPCQHYLAACRWPDGFICHRCRYRRAYVLVNQRRWQCAGCRHQNLPDGRDGSSQDQDPDKTARRVNWLLKWALRSQPYNRQGWFSS